MKTKLIIFIALIIVLLSIVYASVYLKKYDGDIYPSECSERFYADQVNIEYNFEDIDVLLERNLKEHHLKFVCFLGLSYHIPGLNLETDKLIISRYGCKLICTGDITDEKHSKFIQKLYRYYEEYNRKLLNKLKEKQ